MKKMSFNNIFTIVMIAIVGLLIWRGVVKMSVVPGKRVPTATVTAYIPEEPEHDPDADPDVITFKATGKFPEEENKSIVKLINDNIGRAQSDYLCYEAYAKWKIEQVLPLNANTTNAYVLIGVSVRGGSIDGPGGSWAFLLNITEMKFVQKIGLDCFFDSMEQFDLTGDGQPEIIIKSGNGNHAGLTNVYAFDGVQLKSILNVPSYGYRPQVLKVDGVNKIVNYKDSQIQVIETQRVIRPVVYTWDGERFNPSADELLEMRDKYYYNEKMENWQEAFLDELKKYLKNNPADQDALYNAFVLADELKLEKQRAYYRKRFLGTEKDMKKCGICPETDWENRLESLRRVKEQP